MKYLFYILIFIHSVHNIACHASQSSLTTISKNTSFEIYCEQKSWLRIPYCRYHLLIKTSYFNPNEIKKVLRTHHISHLDLVTVDIKQENTYLSALSKPLKTNEEKCPICLDFINEKDSTNLPIATLPCKHTFHKSCIDPWFFVHKSCPVCRRNYSMEHFIVNLFDLIVKVKVDLLDLSIVKNLDIPDEITKKIIHWKGFFPSKLRIIIPNKKYFTNGNYRKLRKFARNNMVYLGCVYGGEFMLDVVVIDEHQIHKEEDEEPRFGKNPTRKELP